MTEIPTGSLEMHGFKCVLVGDASVGKTTLKNQYLGMTISDYYAPTLGANFAVKKIITDGHEFQWQIWDIAGQVMYNEIRKRFYTGTMGTLVLYDITNRKSFDNVKTWLVETWSHSGRGTVPSVIIANKNDLRGTTEDEVTTEEGVEKAKELQGISETPVIFFETSALTGYNVEKTFLDLANAILDHFSSPEKILEK